MNAANEYHLLEKLILAARAQGSLQPEAEVGIVDRMEFLWLSMSDEETAEADARALRILQARAAAHSAHRHPDELRDLELDQSRNARPRSNGMAA